MNKIQTIVRHQGDFDINPPQSFLFLPQKSIRLKVNMQLYLFSFLELTFSTPYKEIKRAKMANKETLEKCVF